MNNNGAEQTTEEDSTNKLIEFGNSFIDALNSMDMTGEVKMGMAMNQLGSNYFVFGDYIVPSDCNNNEYPDNLDLNSLFPEKADSQNEQQGFDMSMNQIGSNFFVMGDYIKPDDDFISDDEFFNCFTEDLIVQETDNDRIVELKKRALYDCVSEKEIARRSGENANQGPVQPGSSNPSFYGHKISKKTFVKY